jgi:hypothetical protein
MSPEKALYEFIRSKVEAANSGDILFEVEVCPTKYHTFANTAIRIGNCESEFVSVGDEVNEYDADILIEILDKIGLDEKVGYVDSRERVREIAKEVCRLLFKYPHLNQNNCSLQLQKGFRSFAKENGSPHAVAIIAVIVNPS